MLLATSNGKTHGFSFAAFLCLSIYRDEEIAAKKISIKSVGQMYQAPSKKPSNNLWMLTKAVQAPDNNLFLHGSSHHIQNTAVSSCLGWMDKGLHGCWETAQPAGCNQNLSASELSSSTCYFLPLSVTER